MKRFKIDKKSRFYKNCKNVRKRGGIICKSCPFRESIEIAELLEELKKPIENKKRKK